jgi:hypothetical protein
MLTSMHRLYIEYYCVHEKGRLVSSSELTPCPHTFFFSKSILMLFSHLYMGLSSGLFPQIFQSVHADAGIVP